MAQTATDASRALDGWLEGYSASVGVAVRGLAHDEVSLWQLADALLDVHRAEYGAQALRRLGERRGEARAAGRWLELVATMFDRDALAHSSSVVIDGPLTLLALARLDESLDQALRRAGVRARLEERLGFAPAEVFRPWALAARPTQWVDLGPCTPAPATSILFSPDGRLLALGQVDGTVRLCDVVASVERAQLSGHIAAFSPDSRLLAIGQDDGTVRLWDAVTLVEHAPLRGHTGTIWHVQFVGDGGRLLTAATDGQARGWDVSSATPRAMFSVDQDARRVWSSPGARLAAFEMAGGLGVLHMGGARTLFRLLDAFEGASHVAVSAAALLVAAALPDGRLGVWSPDSEWLHDISGWFAKVSPVQSLAFSPDGQRLAVAAGPEIGLFDQVREVMEGASWHGHRGDVVELAFAPDGSMLASSGGDEAVRVWGVPSGIEQKVLKGRTPGSSLLFSPDGRLLVSAGDGALRFDDVISPAGYDLDRRPIGLFSPDGRHLVTAGGDEGPHIWEEIEVGGELPAVAADLPGHTDLIGVGADVAAIANLIAASETSPPLSIGLFGDWGSGKSFLIEQIQQRVRRLALRSQRVEGSAYCAHVRNITFNAWQYADANLWASLVAHIFDELARPEPAAGVTEDVAWAQARRAATVAVEDRLGRARGRTRRAESRRRLLLWTWGLAGAGQEDGTLDGAGVERELQVVSDAAYTDVRLGGRRTPGGPLGRRAAKLLLPTPRSRIALACHRAAGGGVGDRRRGRRGGRCDRGRARRGGELGGRRVGGSDPGSPAGERPAGIHGRGTARRRCALRGRSDRDRAGAPGRGRARPRARRVAVRG